MDRFRTTHYWKLYYFLNISYIPFDAAWPPKGQSLSHGKLLIFICRMREASFGFCLINPPKLYLFQWNVRYSCTDSPIQVLPRFSLISTSEYPGIQTSPQEFFEFRAFSWGDIMWAEWKTVAISHVKWHSARCRVYCIICCVFGEFPFLWRYVGKSFSMLDLIIQSVKIHLMFDAGWEWDLGDNHWGSSSSFHLRNAVRKGDLFSAFNRNGKWWGYHPLPSVLRGFGPAGSHSLGAGHRCGFPSPQFSLRSPPWGWRN